MRCGLAGAGEIGKVRARAIQATPGFELVAAADPRLDRARKLTARAFPDYGPLLEDATIDAVIVATPPDSHEAVTLAALEAGKHVLCEKPLAPHPDAARRMVEAARRAGRVLAVGFNQRHFPAVRFVKQVIEAGELGTVRHIRAYAGHRGPEELHARWESDAAITGGGALMDNGIHLIDHVRYLGGEFDHVAGLRADGVWKKNGEDNGFALLRAADGRWASLHASWTEWRGYRFSIEAFGDLGVARASYGPMFATATVADAVGARPRTVRRFFPWVAVREKLRGWQSTVQRTFEQELLDFAARAAGGGGRSAVGFDGFRAVEIAQAVYRSSQTREEVRLSDPF